MSAFFPFSFDWVNIYYIYATKLTKKKINIFLFCMCRTTVIQFAIFCAKNENNKEMSIVIKHIFLFYFNYGEILMTKTIK